jgi:hypothetical protein
MDVWNCHSDYEALLLLLLRLMTTEACLVSIGTVRVLDEVEELQQPKWMMMRRLLLLPWPRLWPMVEADEAAVAAFFAVVVAAAAAAAAAADVSMELEQGLLV